MILEDYNKDAVIYYYFIIILLIFRLSMNIIKWIADVVIKQITIIETCCI